MTLVLLLATLRSAVTDLATAARRWRARMRRPPSAHWPKGWTPPFAGGWGTFLLLLGVGGGSALAALIALLNPSPRDDQPTLWTLATGAFALACLAVLPGVYPGPRRGRPWTTTLRVGDRSEPGVALPYSLLRTSAAALAAAPMAAASLGAALLADADARVRVAGVVGVGFFGLGFVYLVVRQGLLRRWWVVLTPSTVAFQQGRARILVPWSEIGRAHV